MTGAEWMVRTLRERGVEVVFLLCGNGLKPFLDACVEGGMTVVDTRNEQAAAYMADAWGRMTGRLGVVATASGEPSPVSRAEPVAVSTHAAPDANLLNEAAAWIAEAKRPFLIAGSGVFYANASKSLAEFAGATDIPILSHLWDRGCVQE